jgi:hypothetical protein
MHCGHRLSPPSTPGHLTYDITASEGGVILRQRGILVPRRLLQWAGPWIQWRLKSRIQQRPETSGLLWRQRHQRRPRRDPQASEHSAGELGQRSMPRPECRRGTGMTWETSPRTRGTARALGF